MMKKQTVKKGKHFTKFFQRFWWPVKNQRIDIAEILLYGPGLKYDIDKDQADWNKLPAGIYFDLFRPHGQTIMIGWRYNPDTQSLELTPYYHNIKNRDQYKSVGSVPGYVNESNILSIPLSEYRAYIKVTIYMISVTEVDITVEDLNSGNTIRDVVHFDREKLGKKYSRGNLYVGGNRPAQADVHAHVKFL
jgi:hypothetical protein